MYIQTNKNKEKGVEAMSKITHEQARIEAFSYNCESIEVLLKYINQQEKQEKLLELYKELIIELDLELEEFKRDVLK